LRKWKHEPERRDQHTAHRGNKLFTYYQVWYFQDRNGKRSKFKTGKKLSGVLYRITKVDLYRKEKEKEKPSPTGPWIDAETHIKKLFARYKIPYRTWTDQMKDKLLPSHLPLALLRKDLGFFNKVVMTDQALGLQGRARSRVAADLQWWAIIQVPKSWGHLAVMGDFGSQSADLSHDATRTEIQTPDSKQRGSIYALVSLPHTWEPKQGELKAAREASKKKQLYLPSDPGYTMLEVSQHFHKRIWSKTLEEKMTRWKAHLRWYQAGYNKRFGTKVTLTPVEFIGFAVRMWL